MFVSGDNVSEATFDINFYLNEAKNNHNKHQYIRLTVTDKEGNVAHTRPYYVDEL